MITQFFRSNFKTFTQILEVFLLQSNLFSHRLKVSAQSTENNLKDLAILNIEVDDVGRHD
jgi:hypothetical protein